jgi:hypothetical protein
VALIFSEASMNRSLFALLTLGLACTGTTDDTAEIIDDAPSCDITVDDTWPASGTTDFYFRDSIEFTLSEPDPNAEIIFSRSGVQTTEDDGLRIVFMPDQPLPPSTDFEVALDYCHGSPTIEFSTSELGGSLENPLDIEGMTYRVDMDSARYLDNPGVADFLMGWLSRDLLFQINEIEDGGMNVRLAIATDDESDEQDLCFRSFDIEGMELDGSDLLFSADDVLFAFYAGSLQVGDFELQATVAPDLSWLGGAEFSGWVNVTDFAAALDLIGDEDICDIIDNLDATCEPCPSDSSQSCVTLSGDRIIAHAVDIDLELIEERDSHPDCPAYEEE